MASNMLTYVIQDFDMPNSKSQIQHSKSEKMNLDVDRLGDFDVE